MSFLDRIAGRLGFQRVHNELPPTPLSGGYAGSSLYDALVLQAAGLPVANEHTALTVTAVHACVNLIAGAIASLPMNVYRRDRDGDRSLLVNDELWWLLNEEFTPRWSAASGWEFLGQSLLLQGDAFARIRRSGPRIVGLEPIHPSRVTVAATPDGMRLVYAVANDPTVPGGDRKIEVFDQDDMLHVPGFGFNGLRGVSPLRHSLRMAASVSLATQEYAGRFFSNSSRPDIVISTDKPLTQEQADELRDRWAQIYQGAANAHKPAVMGAGAKIERLTMTAEDAQFLETRQFQIEEIARAFGVPPFMIGHNEKTTSWGSGVEAMGIGFVRYTLRQHLNKFHNEINRKFFRTAGKVAEFDTTELERADTKSLFDAFRVAIGRAGEPAFMSVNEVRRRLNLNAVSGGDELHKESADAPEQVPQSA
jgi:HK97 family phage portal protein